MKKIFAGFIGAGGIARSHAFALNSLKYYYNDSPVTELVAVSSATEKSRELFASQFSFKAALTIEEFFRNDVIDTVFILGPNKVHFEHLRNSLLMPSIRRIYIEKPVCSSVDEEEKIALLIKERPNVMIQAGFQFLFIPSVREALKFWRSGQLGNPLHFEIKYYHGDYLQKQYREKRATRLTPAPDGGAMADLGSHAISMLTAFLGKEINIYSAIQSGDFKDVDSRSDLFSLISLYDRQTGAAGSISASRIASGTGDTLALELYAEKGTLRFSTLTPDYYEYYLEGSGSWNKVLTCSNYRNITSFPSGHVPPGWLRSLIHAHYVFLTDNDMEFIPDITHGLDVQRIVRQTAEHLEKFKISSEKK